LIDKIDTAVDKITVRCISGWLGINFFPKKETVKFLKFFLFLFRIFYVNCDARNSVFILSWAALSGVIKKELEIWGRAQLEAARRPKSDWKYNLWG